MSQSTQTHHSCVACASRLLFSFTSCPRKVSFYTVGDYGQEVCLFNLSYDQAVVQARRGCEFMEWLISIPSRANGTQLRAALSNVGVIQVYFEWVTDPKESVLGGIEPLTLCASERYALGSSFIPSNAKLTISSDAAALEVLAKPPNHYPSSRETMLKCRKWLEDCLTKHQACPQPPPSPSSLRRLIKVSGSISAPHLKLVMNSNISQFHYAALSYCWGGDQSVVLRQHNLQAWFSNIPYSSLPQTIRDAIKVTRELSLEYLWVDALCIIQDDSQDKLDQISQMADVYEQAYITISASRAASVEDGFLQTRRVPRERSFRLPFKCKDGKLGSIILWNKRSVGWREPIDQRGWTLQESLISVRNLQFGENQVRWQCRSSGALSTQVDGWTPGKIENFGVNINWDIVAGRPSQLALFEMDFVGTWKRIVKHYSRRTLGNPDDKLMALSSIARKLGQLSGNEYVAGLWKHALPGILFWRPLETGKYALKYIAPSWSWASINGAIEFDTFNDVQMDVINISVVTMNPSDSYSPVTAGRLQVWAKVRQVMIRPYTERYPILKHQRLSFSHPSLPYAKIGYGYCDVSADDLDQDVWNKKVLLLQVALHGGLILRELEDETFFRIGIFNDRDVDGGCRPYDPRKLWSHPDWVESSITIV